LTVGDVAAAVGWSTSKISRYELGRSGLKPDEVEKLLDFYGVADPERAQLLTLAHDAARKGWWEDYTDVLSEDYLTLIGLEAEATSVSQVQIEVIPGLLQTEDYATHVHLGYGRVMPIPPGVIERRVKVRMIRQTALTGDQPLELSAVLDESVLLRRVGDHSVMRAQMLKLAQVADLPNITLRVRALNGERSLVSASFSLFQFGPTRGEAILHDVVVTENIRSEFYVEGEADTYEHRLAFQHLADESLTPLESRELFLKTARDRWA
jgi:hypothetical protein